MKTKYIKVSISKNDIGKIHICENESGKVEIGAIHQSPLDYSFTCISKIQGKESYMYDVKYILHEVPDYEEEMKEILSMALNRLENTTEYEVVDFYKEDCDKIRNFLNK